MIRGRKKGYKVSKETCKKISEIRKKIGSPWNKGRIAWNRGKKSSEETKRKCSIALKGRIITEETKKKISLANKGHIVTEQTKQKLREKRKLQIFSEETHKKMRNARAKRIGDKSPCWKGGISAIDTRIRNSQEYFLWRKSVFERDNFTCQKYQIKGGDLVAHHINNFAEKKELRFAIDNGITLSKKAHQEFHRKYGIKNNTREQLEEFLNK